MPNKASRVEAAPPPVPDRSETLSEQACRRIIAAYRTRIDWVVSLSEWEDHFARGLEELGLPRARRGINLRSVLDTLPLESKFRLAVWAFRTFSESFKAEYARHLAAEYELKLPARAISGKHLAQRHWETFSDDARLALAKDHRRYKHAQTVLFRRYQTLLHKMVNRQVFDPEKRQDAYQEASLGLIHAIDKVEDSSASFGSYARTWIARHIRNHLMENHFPVHVPINLASRILRSRDDEEEMENADPKKVVCEALRNLAKPGLSLDQMTDDEDQPRQFSDPELVLPSEETARNDLHHMLRECLAELTDKQREVLALRYGLNGAREGLTLSVIADAVGISHQQVSMREKRALQRLEAALKPMLAEVS
ncbi:MAG: sigma-70 family RNA polymerase sigma factor [Opitutales bacterium]